MKMKYVRTKLSRSLGAAFFLQAFTSLASGALLFNPLVDPEDISKTMFNLGNHAFLVSASIACTSRAWVLHLRGRNTCRQITVRKGLIT